MGFGKELFFYGTGFGFGALGYSLMKEGDDLSVIGAGLLGLGIISVIYGSAYGIAYRKANESKEKTSQLEEKTSQLEKKLRGEMKILEKRANMTDAEKFAEKKIYEEQRNKKIEELLKETTEIKYELDKLP